MKIEIKFALELEQLHELLEKYANLLEDYDKKLIKKYERISAWPYTSVYQKEWRHWDRSLVSKTLHRLNIAMNSYAKGIIFGNEPSYNMYKFEYDETVLLIDNYFNNKKEKEPGTDAYMRIEFLGELNGLVGFLISTVLGLLKDFQHNYLRTLPPKEALSFIDEKLYGFEIKKAAKPALSRYEVHFDDLELDNLSILKKKLMEDAKIPNDDLIDNLIKASVKLQGMQAHISNNEKARTQLLSSFIETFISKDESGFGLSQSKKSIGEPDIKIERTDGSIVTLCEGLNLRRSFDKTKIELHVRKLFNYDLSGLKENFILVFCELMDFKTSWDKYLRFVSSLTLDFELNMLEDISATYSELPTNIKVAKFEYLREGSITSVNHVFIKMNKKL